MNARGLVDGDESWFSVAVRTCRGGSRRTSVSSAGASVGASGPDLNRRHGAARALPGIGRSGAAVLDWRGAHGRFSSVDGWRGVGDRRATLSDASVVTV
jgi:hypothetical protein